MTLVALVLAAAACEPGQSVGPETAGHCCWPQQVWSKMQNRCVGTPACGVGLRAENEQCVIDCPAGQTTSPDTAGHCCWPTQVWSNSRSVCVGVPACPAGLVAAGETCTAEVAPPPAPLVPVPPPQAEPPPRTPLGATPAPQPMDQPVLVRVPEGATPPPPVVEAPPPPPERPRPQVRESTEPVAKPVPVLSRGERYDSYGNFDLKGQGIFDPGGPAMLGFQIDLGATFTRGRRGRFGMWTGFGYLSHPANTFDTRSVVILGGGVFAGIHLGNSVVELLLRAGGVAAGVHQFEQMRWMPKAVFGTELVFALGDRGSGLTVGFDLYFPAGFSFVPRLGFVL